MKNADIGARLKELESWDISQRWSIVEKERKFMKIQSKFTKLNIKQT